MRVERSESSASNIVGRLTETYSVREACQRARLTGDPCLSPHGMFRKLAAGNRKHSIEFLESFGPLVKWQAERIVGVDLTTFWAAHRRFVLATRLFENRDDTQELRKAIEEYVDFTNRPLTDSELLEPVKGFLNFKARLEAEFSKFPGARNLNELIVAQELEQAKNPRPGEGKLRPLEKLPEWDAKLIRHRLDEGDDPRDAALYFVKAEIQCHTAGIRFAWKAGHDRHADKFYRRLDYDSLLAAIWDSFAADTAGVPWRICPRDQNIFYPPRADRFYCTSAEQVAASKADYDRRRKAKRRKKLRARGGLRKC